jgi:peptidoglycan/LPS O-acetylase OafA/YrhL
VKPACWRTPLLPAGVLHRQRPSWSRGGAGAGAQLYWLLSVPSRWFTWRRLDPSSSFSATNLQHAVELAGLFVELRLTPPNQSPNQRSMDAMTLRYRADIDGLRALAVTSVILFHTFPKILPGGFIGVDVFFVISGYLITQIILVDLDSGKFSAASFYARRVRRIFPALIIVLIATFAFGWHYFLPLELTSLGKNILASALFSANLMLLSEVGYFDIAAHLKPLLHLWSLGIEEQFYLFWPLMLWAAPRKSLLPATVFIVAASFILNVAMIIHSPSETFYLPFTRAWELLAGATLAQASRSDDERYHEFFATVGIVAVAISLFLINTQTPFPGWAAAIPVAGTVLLLRSEGSVLNRLVLSNRVAVNVGAISYPLYLWHWPLLVFAEFIKFKKLTELERGLVVALAFLLAWLTYKFVERPIRFGRGRFEKPLLACMTMLAAAALVPALGYGPSLPDRINRLITVANPAEGLRVGECMLLDGSKVDFSRNCVDQKRPLIAIWGDSTASALVPGFQYLQGSRNFGIAQFTVSSCPPLLIRAGSMTEFCLEENRKIVDLIRANAPDVVLLHAIWDVNDRVENLRPTIEALRAQNIARIVILGPVPVWIGGLPAIVSTYYRRKGEVIPERTWQYVDQISGDANMRKIASELGVDYISSREALCNNLGCVTRIGESLAARDIIHLTPTGSRFLVESIAPELGITQCTLETGRKLVGDASDECFH